MLCLSMTIRLGQILVVEYIEYYNICSHLQNVLQYGISNSCYGIFGLLF